MVVTEVTAGEVMYILVSNSSLTSDNQQLVLTSTDHGQGRLCSPFVSGQRDRRLQVLYPYRIR